MVFVFKMCLYVLSSNCNCWDPPLKGKINPILQKNPVPGQIAVRLSPQRSELPSRSQERPTLSSSAVAVVLNKLFIWIFVCAEMEGAMMPPDERKRCWGCTSLRSATIIVGAFDILVSSIAIIVSVAAIVHTQVFSNLCFIIMRKTYRRRKVGLTLKEEKPGAPLPNVRGQLAKQFQSFNAIVLKYFRCRM